MFDTASSELGEGCGPIETHVTHPAAGVTALTVTGEIDTVTAPVLDTALGRLLDRPDAVLVVDLGGVGFLASSGLAVLIRSAHRASETGRRLRLVVGGRAVRRPLEVTGTDQLFDVHPDLESALHDR